MAKEVVSVEKKATRSGVILLLLFLVVAATLASIYFYLQYQRVKSQTGTSQEVQTLLTDVGKLMVLPEETPTIATVSDINKLKGQPFFDQAQNGDKVLIFPKSREAVLYRPSLKKIIAVSTVNISGAPSPARASTVSVSPTPTALRVVLLNGTTTPGLTTVGQKMLAATDPAVTVVDRDNASIATYTKTIVVDLRGTHQKEAEQVAVALHGGVGALPQGETASKSADILVILGKDFADQ